MLPVFKAGTRYTWEVEVKCIRLFRPQFRKVKTSFIGEKECTAAVGDLARVHFGCRAAVLGIVSSTAARVARPSCELGYMRSVDHRGLPLRSHAYQRSLSERLPDGYR